jgi:hypothetical protein
MKKKKKQMYMTLMHLGQIQDEELENFYNIGMRKEE